MEEVITGDIPTPTKYHNPKITHEIKMFEAIAADEVANEYFGEWSKTIWAEAKDGSLEGDIMRIADTAAVVYKIKQEVALGNNSFNQYEENVWNALYEIKNSLTDRRLRPYIHDFMDYLMGADDEKT